MAATNSMRFRFYPAKALEAILYVAARAGTDKYGTLKILYLADKLHLSQYGRFISGDYYHALDAGPTPMLSYDIIEHAAGMKSSSPIDGRNALRVGSETNPHALVPLRKPDLGELSDSDVECLDEVIKSLDAVPPEKKFVAMWDRVHDEAWQKIWKTSPNSRIDVEQIAELFPNARDIVGYLEQA